MVLFDKVFAKGLEKTWKVCVPSGSPHLCTGTPWSIFTFLVQSFSSALL